MLSRRFVLAAGFGAILSACERRDEAGPSESGVIRFVIQRSDDAGADEAGWSALFADLRAATRLQVRASFPAGGAAVADALHRRQADLVLAASAPALEAVRRGDGEVFARCLADPRAADEVALFARAGSRLTLGRILRCDRTLTLGVASGGRHDALLAADAYLFAPKGIGSARCFRDVRAGPPAALFAGLLGKTFDAVIMDLGQRAAAERGGPAGVVRELWRSPPLPAPSLLWRRDLDPAIKEKLRQFFLTYGQGEAARAHLALLGLAGFAPADNAHLLVEREMQAAHGWLQDKARGDKAREATSRSALDSITAERQDLEARTGIPAGAQ